MQRRARAPARMGSLVCQRLLKLSRRDNMLRRASTAPVSPTSTQPEDLTLLRREATEPASPRVVHDTYQACDHNEQVVSPLSAGFDNQCVRSAFKPMARKHRALVVGCSYLGTRMSYLRGTLTDVRAVFGMLTERYGFARDNIQVLCDQDPQLGDDVQCELPTLHRITDGMKWIVDGASKDDSLFFFFAGHGKLVSDYSGDERNSEYDQCLVPLDADTAGVLVDDSIYNWLIRRVPFGARLTCLIDACTSGTVCDLPYTHTTPIGHRRADAAADAARPPRHALHPDRPVGETVLFAGSADLQEAADVTRRDPAAQGGIDSFGVFTRAFIKAVDYPELTFGDLLHHIRSLVAHICAAEPSLRGAPLQTPQLSSSHRFDIHDTPFSL